MSEYKKTLADEMYEQEENSVERAIYTLNKIAEERGKNDDVKANEVVEKANQKAVVLDYLENAYTGAKMMDDVEMMMRLSRAIMAFDYDRFDRTPTWNEMQEAYMMK